MENELKIEIYGLQYYQDLDVGAFQTCSANLMLDLLMIYKHKLGIESYKVDGYTLSFWNKKFCHDTTRPERNAIIIGDTPLGDQYYDELISAFVNSSIENIDDDIYEIYLDPEHQIVQITSKDEPDFSLYDYGTEQMFMGLLTKLLPWHFGNLNEEQMKYVREVVQNIVSDNGRDYVYETFEDVLKEFDILKELYNEKLSKIGDMIIESRSRNLKDSLAMYKDEYDHLYERMSKMMSQIRDVKQRIFAIENAADEVKSPVQEMLDFLNASYYDYAIESVENTAVYLTYKMPITVYSDETIYDGYIKNNSGSSYLLSAFDGRPLDVVKAAYKHIMDEERDCTVWVSGKIRLDLDTFSFHAENRACRPHTGIHPHLNGGLSCFGDASGIISDYLQNYRMYEALNAIAYSTQQFTLSDTYAGENFLKAVKNYQCIECPDGEFRTFYELMDAIEEGVL